MSFSLDKIKLVFPFAATSNLIVPNSIVFVSFTGGGVKSPSSHKLSISAFGELVKLEDDVI